MTTLAGRTIAALRSEHDILASAVSGLSTGQLTDRSGATEWTVADVLSHLGSGAEITLASFRTSQGDAKPGPDFNQSVWDRWNALSPGDQAAGGVASDGALVAALEAVPAERHDDTPVKLGFLPEALPFASFAAMRLNEVAQHGWDVRAGLDPAATIDGTTAQLLAEHFSGGIGFLLGFIAKADAVAEPAVVEIAETPFRIVIGDGVRITTEDLPATASFDGPLEAAVRLLAGRLTPEHTPAGVDVTGNLTLDGLRSVFPGF